MNRRDFIKNSGVVTAATVLSASLMTDCTATSKKPNILYILADDLGYGDLGCYGQRIIRTPNIDQLAQNGMRFTDHYSGSPVCAPSRCVLLTGRHSGHAYIRGNDEWGERGDVWNFSLVEENPKLEGQRPLAADEVTIAELLKNQGYKTACIGKWGLGPAFSEGSPNKQGFDFFYGYNCQKQAHTYYPLHLWKNEERVQLNNKMVAPHTRFDQSLDPYDEASYADFMQKDYAPDFMIDEALKWLEANQTQPFFLYYPTPIPHLALQAPQGYIDRYHSIIGEEEPYLGGQGYFPCRYPKATYAAMVSYMDNQVGQILQKLKEIGQYENTLVIFSSDNGATYNVGGADTIGFMSNGIWGAEYGKGKGFVREGGLRVPMIASWPQKIKPGTISNHISAFWDVMPTLCQVAGIERPAFTDGISFLPELLGTGKQMHHDYLYWEFPEYSGQQAVRMGQWKAIRMNIVKEANMDIELYDLKKDLQETADIAGQHPEIVERILAIMKMEHEQSVLTSFRMSALGDDI
ncbi:MAG: sulfatase-like hydrolase/transferase [Candidatus Marinimicrobia bacterium]|nr:sulfatase-like hydrolase/transferase [Candidatus Neomarinimicrobiota bacterium]